MLATARDRMAALVDKGVTEEEALAAKPFADLDAKWASNERDSMNFIRMAYNSFKRS
jgi:cyclase